MKKKCEVHRILRRSSCDDLLYMYFSILPFQYESCFHNFVIFTRSGYTVEPLGTDTSLLRTVSYVPTKFSYVFSKKPLCNTDPL